LPRKWRLQKDTFFVLFLLLFMLFYINKFHNYKQTIVPYQLKILEFTYVVLIFFFFFFGERTILFYCPYDTGVDTSLFYIHCFSLSTVHSFQTFLHNLIVRGWCSFQIISCLYWYYDTYRRPNILCTDF
jgi:hypothetical protein